MEEFCGEFLKMAGLGVLDVSSQKVGTLEIPETVAK
jgi:hypothetical protein